MSRPLPSFQDLEIGRICISKFLGRVSLWGQLNNFRKNFKKFKIKKGLGLYGDDQIRTGDNGFSIYRYLDDASSIKILKNSENDLQIIKLGSSDGSSVTNTNVRATVTGTILEIPVKKGDQVIQANTFNPGTTIATIADLNVMIFEGKVDEGEVSKLKKEMDLKVNLAAIENKTYPAKLKFIAPKGIEEAGAVQFKIEGEVFLDDEYIVRAGYSANATIITAKKENVNALSEAVIQYDLETKLPYVEIEVGDQQFERKDIKLGLADGINVEVVSGVYKDDKVLEQNQY